MNNYNLGNNLDISIDHRLRQNSTWLWDSSLCHFRLKHEKEWPWLMLIPNQADLREIHELSVRDQRQLMDEITWCSKAIKYIFNPDKINIGALGNIVPQLHIHIIGRYANPSLDPAWPGPVWGYSPTTFLEKNEIQLRRQLLIDYRAYNPIS